MLEVVLLVTEQNASDRTDLKPMSALSYTCPYTKRASPSYTTTRIKI